MVTKATANIIHRTFCIGYSDKPGSRKTGSAFTLDHEGREYLITAKHVVEQHLASHDTLDVIRQGSWNTLQVKLVGHSGDADISVIAVSQRLTPSDLPLHPSSQGLYYGQDVLFLGFPYGWTGQDIGAGYPLPFVKKATVSLLQRNIFYLDGHNNRGFSGGPVVFHHQEDPGNALRVASVVSSYQSVEEPVLGPSGPSELYMQDNTGIIVTHNIKWAMALISANPIGFPLSDSASGIATTAP